MGRRPFSMDDMLGETESSESSQTTGQGMPQRGRFAMTTRNAQGIKAGTTRELDKMFYIVPAVVGVSVLGVGLLARKVFRGVAGVASDATAKRANDVVGTGFWTKKYYEGGFQKAMTKREASLILGCRESANKEMIQKKYRTLMKMNHPDLGGSRYIGVKINEAKDFLTKTARAE
mmetsp:Transcript_27505/g.48620  ORF Transcript_27505/g.48620 Transcript_27505/m.48620 type:complete len:175 (+) Transcript_27505:77-601(+)|eukprot:CAMPEP_0197517324 /NCGR_PEP_ID=MMETSP1318-20131121/2309_1 /TAXON_ID=552666 /ORGANISM="Partenskyella glossopodia, Strain RCC365" /LENGTH=174 /DNA_ID=CAMNT_0043066781 /DNA_START=66 /DNA_END=590 /DNA_ORIENTATION=-